jgi:hypothetical protein
LYTLSIPIDVYKNIVKNIDTLHYTRKNELYERYHIVNMQKIFSFSGRKQSGKTLLANILRDQYGFKILSFADPIKNVASSIFNISKNQLEKQKDQMFRKPVILTPGNLSKIHESTSIDFNLVNEKFKQPVSSIRQFLQILGTDLIRKHNPDWHISQTKLEVDKNRHSNICFADTRFSNELEFVKSLHGETWFIIRTRGYSELSHHISERSLSFQNFDNVIVNNGSDIINFKLKWTRYMDNGVYPGTILQSHNVVYGPKLFIVLGALSSGKCISFINDTTVFKFKNRQLFTYFNECFPCSEWSDAALLEYFKKHGIIPFVNTSKNVSMYCVNHFWNLGYKTVCDITP